MSYGPKLANDYRRAATYVALSPELMFRTDKVIV